MLPDIQKIPDDEKQPTVASPIKPSELLLSYHEFNRVIKGRELDTNTKKWLGEWNSWDLACSPMDDKERSFIRYGHHLGFFRGITA